MVARTFSKPQPARQLEARARAKRYGARVEVQVHGRLYTIRSRSNPGDKYTLRRTADGWLCGSRATTTAAAATTWGSWSAGLSGTAGTSV